MCATLNIVDIVFEPSATPTMNLESIKLYLGQKLNIKIGLDKFMIKCVKDIQSQDGEDL